MEAVLLTVPQKRRTTVLLRPPAGRSVFLTAPQSTVSAALARRPRSTCVCVCVGNGGERPGVLLV